MRYEAGWRERCERESGKIRKMSSFLYRRRKPRAISSWIREYRDGERVLTGQVSRVGVPTILKMLAARTKSLEPLSNRHCLVDRVGVEGGFIHEKRGSSYSSSCEDGEGGSGEVKGRNISAIVAARAHRSIAKGS